MDNGSALFVALVNKIKDNLLPLPTTLDQLNRLDLESSTSTQITKIIEMDQAMVSRLLKLANSAYYGVSQRITTVSGAIVCLGFNRVKSMAFTVSANKIFKNNMDNYHMDSNILFEHSIAVAIGARLISEKTGIGKPEESYVMGLIHDIGKVVLNQFLGSIFGKVWEYYKQNDKKFFQAEREVLGFHHGDIGAEIAKKWNFPIELCNSIGFHHEPEKAKSRNMGAYVVHLANSIAKTLDVGTGIVKSQDLKIEMDGIFHDKYIGELKLQKEQILEMRLFIMDRIKQVLNEIKEG